MEVYFESEMFEDALSMVMAMQTLCVDGSCNMEVHHPSFRTSAWTCVAYNAQEEEIGFMTGPVWRPIHASSGSAEMVGMTAAFQLIENVPEDVKVDLHSDYLAAVRLAQGPRGALVDHRRLFAGLIREWASAGALAKSAVHKVAAHTGGGALAERGNARADAKAKERVRAQALGDTEVCDEHHHRSVMAKKVVKYAGEALAIFPSVRSLCVAAGIKRLPKLPKSSGGNPAAVEQRSLRIVHQWSEAAVGEQGVEFHICLACGKRARTNFDTECSGQRQWICDAAENPHQHTLWLAAVVEREGDLVVLCSTCGRMEVGASGRMPFYSALCDERLEGRWRTSCRRRFFQGRHPDTRLPCTLTAPVRLGE